VTSGTGPPSQIPRLDDNDYRRGWKVYGRSGSMDIGGRRTNGQSAARGVQSLKLGAATQLLPLIAGYGVNLLATPYVVSRLGLHDFGIWSITGAIAQVAVLFDLGVSRAASRYVALFHARGDTRNERSVLGVCLSVLIGLSGVLYAVPLFIPGFLNQILHTRDVALARFLVVSAMTMLICGLLGRTLAAASIGRGRYMAANIGVAVLAVAQVVGGVVALAGSPTLRSFAVGTAVGAGVGLCAVVATILFDERRIVIGWPKAALAREIIAYGIKVHMVGVADIVMFQSGKLIAGIAIGPAAAGVYELGSRLAQGAQAFGGAASVALTNHLTRAYALGGKAEILVQYSHLTRRNAAVTIFLPLLLCATSFSAVPFWLGERHNGVVMVLAALAPGVAVSVSTGVCSASLLAIGRSGILGATAIAVAAISAAVALPLAQAFGLKGIAAAFGCCIVVGDLLLVWFLQSRMGISMAEYLGAIRGPFALGIVATLAALPIGIIAMPQDRASALVPLLLSSGVFCTIYAILGWQFDYLPRFRSGGKKSRSHGRLLCRSARVQHPVVSHLAADERLTEPAAKPADDLR
jgi:O-antigen/teichoic acid export membrane protein